MMLIVEVKIRAGSLRLSLFTGNCRDRIVWQHPGAGRWRTGGVGVGERGVGGRGGGTHLQDNSAFLAGVMHLIAVHAPLRGRHILLIPAPATGH